MKVAAAASNANSTRDDPHEASAAEMRVARVQTRASLSTEVPCAEGSTSLSRAGMRAVLRHFIADVECGVHFPNVEHVYSQVLVFGSRPFSDAAALPTLTELV